MKEKVKEKRFKKILNIDKRSNTEQNESCYNKSKIYITQEDNDFKNKESEISEINKMINTTDDGLSPTNRKNKNIYKSNKKFINFLLLLYIFLFFLFVGDKPSSVVFIILFISLISLSLFLKSLSSCVIYILDLL